MSKITLSLLAIMLSILPASAATRAVNTSGNDIFWIVLTIALTLFFAMRGMESGLLRNPVYLIALLVILILIYILFQAFSMVFGIGEAIDSQILNTANGLTNLTRLL